MDCTHRVTKEKLPCVGRLTNHRGRTMHSLKNYVCGFRAISAATYSFISCDMSCIYIDYDQRQQSPAQMHNRLELASFDKSC